MKRVVSFDIIRIVAICAVVMIHSSGGFVFLYPPGTINFMFGNICDGASRLGVPLFVMLSGALILREEYEFTIKKSIKYALNIIGLLYFWSLIYALVWNLLYPSIKGLPVSLNDFFSAFLEGYYHQWYLFRVVGLYLLSPILKSFIKKENCKLVLWYIFLSIIILFAVPFIDYWINRVTNSTDLLQTYLNRFNVDFLGEFIVYYLLGWYISTIEISKKYRRYIYVSGIVGILITILCTHFFAYDGTTVSEFFYSMLSINVLCYSLAVFTFLFYQYQHIESTRFQGIIRILSDLSFGVYIIHPFTLSALSIFVFFDNALIQVPLNWGFAIIVSFASCFVMSKIPIVKKLIKN